MAWAEVMAEEASEARGEREGRAEACLMEAAEMGRAMEGVLATAGGSEASSLLGKMYKSGQK